MYRRFVVPLVVKRSQKVVTVSHSEKNRITGYFHNIDDRLSVIYNGLSNRFIPVTDTELLNKTKRAYGLPEKFIFLLGNTDPKKNTKGVLTAYAKYRGLSKNPILLVIADFPEASLDAILTQQGIRDILSNIIRLDYINNQDLPAIFSLSTLFIYPSFWESFGIPILEAMACNTAVITSNVFSMPEIAGDAALLVDPKDPDHMANAMISLSTDEKLAAEMRKKGLVQAKLFSSKKMASEYLEIYRQVIHERNRKL